TVPASGSRPDANGARGPAAGGPRRRPRRGFAWRAWYMAPILAVVVIVSAIVSASGTFPAAIRIEAGRAIERAFNAFLDGGAWLYEPIAAVLDGAFDSLLANLALISPPVFAAAVVLLVAWFKGVRLALLAVALFLWVILTG